MLTVIVEKGHVCPVAPVITDLDIVLYLLLVFFAILFQYDIFSNDILKMK